MKWKNNSYELEKSLGKTGAGKLELLSQNFTIFFTNRSLSIAFTGVEDFWPALPFLCKDFATSAAGSGTS
jgi:hypothetical protein